MENKRIIDVVNADGSSKEAEVLMLFKLDQTGPDYMIYSFDEKDANGLVKIYTSVYKETAEGCTFEDVPSEEEWMRIKEVMRKVINENKE